MSTTVCFQPFRSGYRSLYYISTRKRQGGGLSFSSCHFPVQNMSLQVLAPVKGRTSPEQPHYHPHNIQRPQANSIGLYLRTDKSARYESGREPPRADGRRAALPHLPAPFRRVPTIFPPRPPSCRLHEMHRKALPYGLSRRPPRLRGFPGLLDPSPEHGAHGAGA